MNWSLLLVLALPTQPVAMTELQRVEKTLKDSGIATDGPGLVAYLRAQTISLDDEIQLARLVRQLGDDDFDRREEATRRLVESGRKAVAHIRPALESKDLEVARRAAGCLEAITEGPLSAIMPGVVRLLVERQPVEAVPVMIGYLRCAGDEAIEDALADGLRAIGRTERKIDPLLLTALADRSPQVRRVAARIVGDVGTTDEARKLAPLLRDPDLRVRVEAAQAALRCGDVAGGPVLLDLVATGPVDVGAAAEEFLARLAGTATPTPTADRAGRAEAWRTWWQRAAFGAGWQPPRIEPVLGRILVAEYDNNRGGGAVYEIGRDGKKRWQIDGLQGPNSVQMLADGRILIAERNSESVSEYDRNGKKHWTYRTKSNPVTAQRLADGSTLVVTFAELLLVDREGGVKMSFPCPEQLRDARMTAGGKVVAITATGIVLEISREGKELRRIAGGTNASGAGYWAAVLSPAEGRYLAAFSGVGKVTEMDATGKYLREFAINSPVSLQRDANGNTLIASFEGRQVIEVDSEGKEVWRAATVGRPFAAVRY